MIELQARSSKQLYVHEGFIFNVIDIMSGAFVTASAFISQLSLRSKCILVHMFAFCFYFTKATCFVRSLPLHTVRPLRFNGRPYFLQQMRKYIDNSAKQTEQQQKIASHFSFAMALKLNRIHARKHKMNGRKGRMEQTHDGKCW